jgi:hypothetical protein
MKKSKRMRILLTAALLLVACGLFPTPSPTQPSAPADTPGPTLAAATETPSDTPEPTPTDTPSPTPFPTRTPTSTPVPPMTITVYFTDHNAYLAATPPYEVGVTRTVPGTPAIARAVLLQFFAGPTPAEAAAGLTLVLSGATGFSNVTIHDTIARVYLTGNCNSQGATYTIANPLYANLIQFGTVSYVKIYDQNGQTQQPTGYSNSIPGCLEP